MITWVLRKYAELVFLSAKFLGAILIIVIGASALVVAISGGTINYSAIPAYVGFWVSMSLVLPLILVGVPYLFATIYTAIARIFE